MIDRIFKPAGSRVWRWRFREKPEDGKILDISLGTSEKSVAEKRRAEKRSKLQLERAGLIPPEKTVAAAQRSLALHLEDFIGVMRRNGKSEKYLANLEFRVGRLIKECPWNTAVEASADSFQMWLRLHPELAAKTSNDYLEAGRCFFNWMVKSGRFATNPLLSVEKVKVLKDKRRQRRAYSHDEMRRLLAAVPPDRRAVYMMASHTGLRRSELSALQWGDLFLDDEPPVVKVRASTTKNGKQVTIRLRPELVALLKPLRETEKPDEVIFKRFPRIERLRRDLKLVGIADVDEMGRHADFHSLRKTVGTNLAKAGVKRREVMDYMRLSDGRLADEIYTDINQLDTGAAVDLLPDYTSAPEKPASPIASLETGAEGHGASPDVTVDGGEETQKVLVKIDECHVLTLSVTMGQKDGNGGSGGARTRNLCRDRAAL